MKTSGLAKNKVSQKSQISELKKINKELDRFVYSASHDLKAPLRSIMGIVQIARSETTDESQLQYLEMIFKSSMKLDNFINDLVNFSRNSRLELKAEKIDFSEILADAFDGVSYMDNASNLRLTSEISAVPFYSDLPRLRVIFGNIVSNAVKYQSTDLNEQPYLRVNIDITPAKATLVFSDNGEGIDKKNHADIFKMFYRASERSQGSGLGLFIVKEVIKKLKGSIKIESKLKKGTTFTVVIPNLAKKQN